jgi:hypothetical protein
MALLVRKCATGKTPTTAPEAPITATASAAVVGMGGKRDIGLVSRRFPMAGPFRSKWYRTLVLS